MTRVKICGNRSFRDVDLAVRHGADAIGLIVGTKFVSEDEISAGLAKEIVAALPAFVTSVLVTHLQGCSEILDLYHVVLPGAIQLHNDLSLDVIKELRFRIPQVKLIKAIHILDESSIQEALSFSSDVDALLLDSRTANRIGGTGMTHDWSVSQRIVSQIKTPVILAGGLTPANVREAIQTVRPFAVDVNSGVDHENGEKDPEKIHHFTQNSRDLNS